jgi:Calcineurin-like phosphoesterase
VWVAPGPGSGTAEAATPSVPAVVAAGASRADASSYPLGSVSFRRGALYIAFLKVSDKEGSVDPSPGIVGGGTGWVQVDDGRASAAGMGMTAYVFTPATALADVALSTGTLSSVHEGMWFSVVEVASGFDAAAPIVRSKAGAGAAATGYVLPFPTTPAPDSLVVAAVAHGAVEESTPNPGWTEVAGTDLAHPYPNRSAHVIFDASEPGRSPGSTWSTAAVRRGVAVEIAGTGTQAATITLAAAGDICKDGDPCARTSDRVAEFAPDVVVTLGDLAYNDGLLAEYFNRYGGGTTPQTRWGRPSIKNITLPGYGNHDCRDFGSKQGCEDAITYFGPDTTFGTDIPGTSGSYWTVRGAWLIVHLNSAGDLGSGQATAAEIAAQNAALRDLLQADGHTCELLAWHHPRFSSGSDHGNQAFVDPWFETAYANGVEVVLSAHDHAYERFGPQDGDGHAVPGGVREFVVGTGGAPTLPFAAPEPNSKVRIQDWGILTMELRDGAYSWAFLDDETAAVDDAGSGACHA